MGTIILVVIQDSTTILVVQTTIRVGTQDLTTTQVAQTIILEVIQDSTTIQVDPTTIQVGILDSTTTQVDQTITLEDSTTIQGVQIVIQVIIIEGGQLLDPIIIQEDQILELS